MIDHDTGDTAMQADLFTDSNIIAQTNIRTTYSTSFGGITVELDHVWLGLSAGSHFAGLAEFRGGPDHVPGKTRRVHVMSSHAKGEIRSYVIDEDKVLRLAGPEHGGEWHEMDTGVARVLGATVHPYTITAGGSVY